MPDFVKDRRGFSYIGQEIVANYHQRMMCPMQGEPRTSITKAPTMIMGKSLVPGRGGS